MNWWLHIAFLGAMKKPFFAMLTVFGDKGRREIWDILTARKKSEYRDDYQG